MHISEGVVSAPVLGAGAALTAVGMTLGLKKIDYQRLPVVALLSAVFFVGSLIHVPIGPASAHLILGGLVGVILGWAAFPAIFMALVLQALLFQYGGLLVLGVNTFDMAMPAVLCGYAFGPLVRGRNRGLALSGGFLAGALSVMIAGLLTALALYLSGEAFLTASQAILITHLPIMAAEGVCTALVVGFLKQVRPAVLTAGLS
jgi:cobalt/nickel transport system permease protein